MRSRKCGCTWDSGRQQPAVLLPLGFLSSARLNPALGFICLFIEISLSTFVVAGVRLIAVASEWIATLHPCLRGALSQGGDGGSVPMLLEQMTTDEGGESLKNKNLSPLSSGSRV